MKKTCLGLAVILASCKVSDPSTGELSSFRSENGERTVAVGFYLNDYPTVIDGAFFPFEMLTFSDEELAEMGDSFRGYSGDVMTGKEPFGGFISEQTINEAKSRKLKDPYHFAGYFLKIMVVHDNIEQLPVTIDLHRGFFPPDFVCPHGVESIKIRADDRALGYPGGGKSLSGDDTYINRTNRRITFCRVNEVNGPYAGKPLYYTRVELFDKSEDYLDELLDVPRPYENLIDKLPGVHQELAVAIRFKYKQKVDGIVDFNINNTVVNLDYNVIPRLNEMLEALQQNSVHNYQGIVESTDLVQEYLYRNRDRAENDGEWQLLKVAQRKWLAIRMILLLMGKNINDTAEELRLQIIESLELTNLHNLYPLAKKITSYASASDYIDEMTKDPQKSVTDGKPWYQGNSNKHFNEMIYRLAIEAGLRQWHFSKRIYRELLSDYDRYILEYGSGRVPLCGNHCSSSERDYIANKSKEFSKAYENLTPVGQRELHDIISRYVKAINAVYPDPYRGATASFKRKLQLQIWKPALDYDNSSDTYKGLYQSYARRYDLVFSEPHGLLLGADAVQKQVQPKRQPDDVNITDDGGKTSYHWKMHPPVDIISMTKAVKQMLDGLYQTLEELTKIKNKIETSSDQQKITSDLADQFHIVPIAQILLIRPDYTYLMKDILRKYSRVRAKTVVRRVVYGVAIAATIAGGALFVASLASLATAGTAAAVFVGAGVADLLSAGLNFSQARGLRQRIEGALFADSLGTNIAAYHQGRQQYHQIQRDLYWSAGFAAIDMAAMVNIGFRFLKTRGQINALTRSWKDLKNYPDVVKQLRRCSTVYCRKFLRYSPVLAENGNINMVFKELKKDAPYRKLFGRGGKESAEQFKEALKKRWLVNKNFEPLLHAEILEDAVRTVFIKFDKIPLTGGRLPRVPIPFMRRGLTDMRMITINRLTDSSALEGLSKNEILDMFVILTRGKPNPRKFLIFPRKREKLLQGQLGLNNKDFQELFRLTNEGPNGKLNEQMQRIYDAGSKKFDKGMSREAKKELKKLYKEKIAMIKKDPAVIANESHLEELVKLGENRERTKVVTGSFKELVGNFARVDKETNKLIFDEKIFGKVIGDLKNSPKWKDINFNSKDLESQGRNLIDNLNKLIIKGLDNFNKP